MATLSRKASAAADARRFRRAELLRVTSELVAEGSPFAELAVETIAARAGVSRQTFYAYFADKQALALALGELLGEEIAEAAIPWLEDGEGDLRPTLAMVLKIFERNRGVVLALVEAAAYDDAIGTFWRDLHGRFIAPAVARLQRLGVEKRVAEARAFTLVWATEGAMVEHLVVPRVSSADLLDSLELIWRAADPVD